MLKEIKHVRQIPNEPRRRWFTTLGHDLIVWFDESDTPIGFQLSYDRDGAQHAFTWHALKGYSHDTVDTGEEHHSGYKMTPILIADGSPEMNELRTQFRKLSTGMDNTLIQFIDEKLRDYD